MKKSDCKYANLDIVKVKTKKQYEIIKKVLGKDNQHMDKTSLRLQKVQDELEKPITKESAELSLKQCGILDNNGEITEPYSEIFIKNTRKDK